MGESCNAPFYLILYYINIFELPIDVYFATRIIVLINISINIVGDVPFGPVKYYSDPIFNSPKLF